MSAQLECLQLLQNSVTKQHQYSALISLSDVVKKTTVSFDQTTSIAIVYEENSFGTNKISCATTILIRHLVPDDRLVTIRFNFFFYMIKNYIDLNIFNQLCELTYKYS